LSFPSEGGSRPGDVAIAEDGDVVVVGLFIDAIEIGGRSLVAVGDFDLLFARFSPGGVHEWSRRLGGANTAFGTTLALADGGGIFMMGSYEGQADFGGGLLPAESGTNVFLGRYSSASQHVFSQRIGSRVVAAAVVDESGDVVVTGFDKFDIPVSFVAKYSPDGERLWEQFLDADQIIHDVAVRSDGSIVAVGQQGAVLPFTSTSANRSNLVDCFEFNAEDTHALLAEFAADGTPLDTRRLTIGDLGCASAQQVEVSAAGDIVMAGVCLGELNLGDRSVSCDGRKHLFVARLDDAGDTIWWRTFGGAGGVGGLAIDGAEVAVAGYFEGTIDFGAGELVAEHLDVYMAKLSFEGNHIWSRRFGADDGRHFTSLDALAVAPNGDLVITGQLRTPVDFGGGELAAGDVADIFIAVFGP
jgi:hypothetical protein